jgi:DNA-binding NarL/FixJ family response regulator
MMQAQPKVRRVVVVDDSRISQAILESTFNDNPSFVVVGVASDATDGFELARKLAPDLITIDLCMPYIDGTALLQMLTNYTSICKIVVSEQITKSISVANKLQSVGASLCVTKSMVANDARAFFKKVVKACESVEAAQGYGAPVLTLSSDHGRRAGFRESKSPVHYGYPIPVDESARLVALREKELANAVRERQFDLVTRYTADATGFPMCALTFIDENTQWIKSSYGYDQESTSRDVAICNYTISAGSLFVIQNAEADQRFCGLASVRDDGLRTYVGYPVISEEGVRLGALCLADTKIRVVTPATIRRLTAMAEIVGTMIDGRRKLAA